MAAAKLFVFQNHIVLKEKRSTLKKYLKVSFFYQKTTVFGMFGKII